MINIGIGIPFGQRSAGIDAQAQAHYNRVIADGGLVPSGLSGVNAFFKTAKTIYGTSDINSAISAAYDPEILGYKLGSGSGTTLGQAAQKLYSIKSTENLLLQSEDFGNASWSKSSVTITTNATTAPNGTMTADLMFPNTNGTNRQSLQTISVVASTTYTISFYAKASGKSWIFLGNIAGSANAAWFNVSTGTLGNVNSPATASIESVGNGWYRCIVTSTSSGTSGFPVIAVSDANNSNSVTANGSDGVFIWGAQVNTGSVALPYTPTTTTAETLADAVQTTAASQPLLLTHTSGENYWWGGGVNGNYCSTPASAQNRITANIDIKVNLSILTGNFHAICSTGGSETNLSYLFFIRNTNTLQFQFSQSGVIRQYITTATLTSNYNGWLRVTRNSSTGQIVFYTSSNRTTWNTFEVINGATGSADDPNTTLSIGALGTTFSIIGKIQRLTISNSIEGTPVVDFNPNQYNPSTSQTQWTSSTGEVWTINKGTTAGQFTGQLVYRTQIGFGGDAQAKSFSPNINVQVNQPDTVYIAYKFDIFNQYQGLIDSNTASTRQAITNFTPSGSIEIAAGVGLTRSGLNQSAISLVTSIFNGANSSIQINNGAQTIGNAGTQKMDGLRIGVLANSPPQFSLNGNIYSLLVAKQADNSTQRTSMYNYIRSINNNAF